MGQPMTAKEIVGNPEQRADPCSLQERARATAERLALLSDEELLGRREEWDSRRRIRAVEGLAAYELRPAGVLVGGGAPYAPRFWVQPQGWPAAHDGCDCPDHTIHVQTMRAELTRRGLADPVQRPLHCKHHYMRGLLLGVALWVRLRTGQKVRVSARRPAK